MFEVGEAHCHNVLAMIYSLQAHTCGQRIWEAQWGISWVHVASPYCLS